MENKSYQIGEFIEPSSSRSGTVRPRRLNSGVAPRRSLEQRFYEILRHKFL